VIDHPNPKNTAAEEITKLAQPLQADLRLVKWRQTGHEDGDQAIQGAGPLPHVYSQR
jgi:hypothetical protein